MLNFSESIRTSSFVKPKKQAIFRGVTIEYSTKLFMADCVLYFLTGRIPVM